MGVGGVKVKPALWDCLHKHRQIELELFWKKLRSLFQIKFTNKKNSSILPVAYYGND